MAQATDWLGKAKAALADIQERRLPALMDELESDRDRRAACHT